MYVTISSEIRQPPLPSTQSTARRAKMRLRSGAYLYFEGDEVESLYQIESGVVRLTRVLEDGRRQVIAFGYPGDIIGFPADGVHHTDCDALVETQLTPFSRRALDDGSLDPELHKALLKAALDEIGAMQDHFMMLGRKSASEKVASFLNVLIDRIGDSETSPPVIDLPMCRSDIADFLGLTTETVCRCITALRRAEVIRLIGPSKVEVLVPQALAQRSAGQLN